MPMTFSPLEAKVLDEIQTDYPLSLNPYGVLADRLLCTREVAYATVNRMRLMGVIRRIGGSFAAYNLGYVSTLVAAQVESPQLDAVAESLNAYAEITHNYLREGAMNLWFTIIAANTSRLEELLAVARALPGVQLLHSLPTLRRFKIAVEFHFSKSRTQRIEQTILPVTLAPADLLCCDEIDHRLIARLCGDIDDSLSPMSALAQEMCLREEDLLERIQRYRASGALRRFGAILRHQQAGLTANGLLLCKVPPTQCARVGELLAAHPAITHCYERQPRTDWPYTLYAMLHGKSRAECQSSAKTLVSQVGFFDYQLVFSLREYKKTSMVYFAEAGGCCSVSALA